ncbi:pentapeptide repeat-containing protein [Tardiphaga sp. 20_F10_N6_6]|uniref:pentapeptide repeat-containing protein n=1 Tax=Tardiphaga sp. 20_F10_N6_6 TaxID=3240788 RepID=UPI003F8CB95B
MKEEPLIESGKTISADKKFASDVDGGKYSNYVFTRLVAKDRRFTKVNFKYTFFEHSYLRDCHFDSCDFTGCRFTNSNLSGSKFSGCKFEYSYFEKTLVEPAILETECPSYENLKRSFARTLRTNFQQLGDAGAANKAMTVELDANATHLKKAAWSNESYYRKHYAGLDRFTIILEWMIFNILDFVWGNGESVGRLFRFLALILILMALYDTHYHGGEPEKIGSYWQSILKSFSLFFGTSTPDDYSRVYLAFITCTRLVVVGFFLSIIIKRFNRR